MGNGILIKTQDNCLEGHPNLREYVLGCLLVTRFSISTVISISLFLAKIAILPHNYVISIN